MTISPAEAWTLLMELNLSSAATPETGITSSTSAKEDFSNWSEQNSPSFSERELFWPLHQEEIQQHARRLNQWLSCSDKSPSVYGALTDTHQSLHGSSTLC